MPFFKYTVRNEHGETVRGKVEAQTIQQAVGLLHNRSLLVISISPFKEDVFSGFKSIFNGISQNEIVGFTRQLSTMVTAGLTLNEALGILRQQSKTSLNKMVGDLQREIEGGSSFAHALELQGKTFSTIYIQLVRAGEVAGVLQDVLARLADTMEKQKEFRSKTKGALIYPVIVVLTMIGVGVVMMIFVIPRLTQMYTDLHIKLPITTQILITTSTIMSQYWFVVLGVLIGSIVGFQKWKSTKKGRLQFDHFILKLPLMGVLQQKLVITEFCRTSSLLLNAGISVLQVLEIIAYGVDNMVYQEALLSARKKIEKGFSLSQSLVDYADIFPPIVLQMISVGEETGKLDDVMMKLSVYFEAETEQEVKNLTTAFEPLVMIVLGLGVGVLVVAIIMPIYQLTTGF